MGEQEWEQILQDGEELQKFYAYLQSRKRYVFCCALFLFVADGFDRTQSVDFWIEVEAYRRLPRAERREQARAISERYLVERAPFAISSSALFAHIVPAALRELEKEKVRGGGRMRTSIFEEAQQYVLRTIVESDLHRFRTSKSKGSSTVASRSLACWSFF